MKKILIFLLSIVLLAGIASCKHKAKEKSTWSDAQKTKWKTQCKQLLGGKGLYKKDADALCDCMLNKTSEKYTPEEASKITTEEERKLWQECDYQW